MTVKAFDDALAKLGAPEGPISKIGSIAGTTAQILIELFTHCFISLIIQFSFLSLIIHSY